jgi:hypothetical protein
MCQDCQPELQLDQCIDGYNAFTITTANFTMPAENSVVNVAVSNLGQNTGKWGVIGQVVYVYNAGYMQVTASSPTSLTLRNLKNTSTSYYMGNAAPGTNILTGSKVSPAGLQGPIGNDAKSGQILIDVDYTNYNNTTTGSFTNQKIISLPSAIFSANKDTVELQCNLLDSNSSVTASKVRFILSDGTNLINLLPSNFTSGIDLPIPASTKAATFIKIHLSRASATTVNIVIELETGIGNVSGDLIYNSFSSIVPLSFKYKTVALGPITLSGTLTLTIDTKPGDSNGVSLNFSKCIKQQLI